MLTFFPLLTSRDTCDPGLNSARFRARRCFLPSRMSRVRIPSPAPNTCSKSWGRFDDDADGHGALDIVSVPSADSARPSNRTAEATATSV